MANNHIPDAALAELDRLHAAATPGEWRPEVPAWNKHRRNCKTAISSPTGTVLNTVTPKVPRDGVIGYRPPGECKIAQYIAALHNAYPALRQRPTDAESRLAEAERERDELEALRHRIDSLQEAYNGVVRIIRNLDRDALCDWHDEFGCEEYLAAWLAARDAQQRREGAVEAYERAADMLSVFPGGADAEEMMRDAAKRLREGKDV